MRKLTLLIILFKISIIVNAKNNKIDAANGGKIVSTYFPNGRIHEKGVVKDSIKVGIWMSWYENGQIADSGEYVPLDKGRVKFIDFLSSSKFDTINIINKDLKYFSARKGSWKFYYSNGKIKEESIFLPYIKISFGSSEDPRDPGTFVESYWITEIKSGVSKEYRDSGIIHFQSHYVNGELKDKWNRFNEKGDADYETTY
jgi:antitoxin component YwqK of YwqJK toxin-antitoxin module